MISREPGLRLRSTSQVYRFLGTGLASCCSRKRKEKEKENEMAVQIHDRDLCAYISALTGLALLALTLNPTLGVDVCDDRHVITAGQEARDKMLREERRQEC